MKESKVANAMNYLDDDLVTDAIAYKPKRQHILRSKRWIAIAACLCIMLCSATAFAMSGIGTQIIAFFTDRTEQGSDDSESGYDLSVFIERIPVGSLSEAIRDDAEAAIKKQYKEHTLYSSWMPNHWQKPFETHEEACSYIGLDGLKAVEPKASEKGTKLNVFGDKNGKIQSINLETVYEADRIRLQLFTQIYTEYYSETITTGTRTTESVEFNASYYQTQNGKQCHIISSSALESGYACLDGYLVDNGILYKLHIAYLNDDAEMANDLMHQWADLF